MKIALHNIKVAELVAGFEDKAEEGAPNPGDLNRRGVIRIGNEYKSTYARLLIKRRYI